MNTRYIYFLVVYVLSQAVCTNASRADDIDIAIAGPFSGRFAAFGAQMKSGAEQAVIDINDAGGLNGKRARFVVADDDCNPSKAVEKANELASKKTNLVIGHLCSKSTIAVDKIYSDNKITQIIPFTIDYLSVTPSRIGAFRICCDGNVVDPLIVDYLTTYYKDQTIGIAYDTSSGSKEQALALELATRGALREIVSSEFSPDQGSIDSTADRQRSKRIGILYVQGEATAAIKLVERVRQIGMDMPVILPNVPPERVADLGVAGRGLIISLPLDAGSIPGNETLVARFRKNGLEPSRVAFLTYAALQVYVQAARKAGNLDYGAVTDVMRTGDFKTVIGGLRFDTNRNVNRSLHRLLERKSNGFDQMCKRPECGGGDPPRPCPRPECG